MPDAAWALVNILLDRGVDVFCDEQQRYWVKITMTPGKAETLPLKSERLRFYLGALYASEMRSTAPPGAIRGAIHHLGGLATVSPQRTLYNRFARIDGALWVDLADGTGRAVCVDASGWQIVEQPPVYFRRHQHQRPLPEPVGGGNVGLLLDLLNLSDDDQRLLVTAWETWAMLPGEVHPILALVGEKGSAKTTTEQILRAAIDPSAMASVNAPKTTMELTQVLDQHAVLALDNLSRLSGPEVDLLCQAVTAGAATKRKLRTDEDAVIFQFRGSVILSSIILPSNRPDFLDRLLRLQIPSIPKGGYRSTRRIRREFKETAPLILGSLLDLVAASMSLEDGIEVPGAHRLVDFARHGEAVSRVLGYHPGRFLDVLDANINDVTDDAMRADPVAMAIRNMAHATEWEGTSLELLQELPRYAEPHDRREWPRSEDALGMRLSVVRPVLARVGVEIDRRRGPPPRRDRLVRLWLAGTAGSSAHEEGVQGVQGVQGGGNGGNGKRPGVVAGGGEIRRLLPPHGQQGEA
jgi:hypothetical protein